MSSRPVVPFVDLTSQFAEIQDEVMAGFADVLSSTAFIGGPEVKTFEQRYASYSGVAHCVGVANGTDAVELALRGVGVEPGDEVIVPANTFIATAEAVSRIGAVTVFVDVDDECLLIAPDAVERAITDATRAVVPVHLFGQSAPVERILDLVEPHDIAVIEDAAQSQGARRHGRVCGGLGQVAATSFYPGKNLGAAGDAGAVTTDDPLLAERVRVMANHGSRAKYEHEMVGFNSRLDSLQAVVLNAKLTRLEEWNCRRRAAAARYDELLTDHDGVRRPVTMEGNDPVWHLYVVRVQDRDAALSRLLEAGVSAGIHYPVPVHLTDAYSGSRFPRGSCPVAETAAERILSLPMYPHISPELQEQVVDALTGK